MASDPWNYWRQALAGNQQSFHEGNPQPGFYRWPQKPGYGARKVFTPVAYWPDADGTICCRIGDEDVDPHRGADIWVNVATHPVTEVAYRSVAENGQLWPDEPETVPISAPAYGAIGHNRPPPDDSFETLQEEIDRVSEEGKRLLAGDPITEQFQADLVANVADRLQELSKRANEQRSIERKPYDQAAHAVQLKWAPLLLAADVYKNLKYKLLTPWEIQKRRAAEEAKRAGETPPVDRSGAGTRGRRMALKNTKRAEITDYDACLAHFADAPDIKATVQDLANRAVRAGMQVPGAKLVEEEKVV